MATQTESGAIPTPPPPTKEQWDELSRDVKAQLLDEMGEESWYLIIVSSIRPYCVNGWSRLSSGSIVRIQPRRGGTA
jgi:hypothetical protein